MEIGLYTFAEMTPDPANGQTISPAARLAEVIEAAELADQVGLDVYGLGEHHRPDFAGSAPAVVLAAIAARTKRIRLTSTVTVLSTDDPVRVLQQYATLDLISRGRAEIMVGRGVFTEPFGLFGQDLRAYDEIFDEKLRLLLRLRDEERITWSGRFRPPMQRQGIYPRPFQSPLPVWVGVGGSPLSAARAGRLGLPMALGIVGGDPLDFAPLAALHRANLLDAGHSVQHAPLSLNLHGFVAESAAEAADAFFPPYAAFMTGIGKDRGWPPVSRTHFDKLIGPRGSMLLGTPEMVVEKILRHHAVFQNQRCLIQLSAGTMPHDKLLRAIELIGAKVAPAVRDAIGGGHLEKSRRPAGELGPIERAMNPMP